MLGRKPKLTEAQAREIYLAGRSARPRNFCSAKAREYGVNRSSILRYLRAPPKNYRHIEQGSTGNP